MTRTILCAGVAALAVLAAPALAQNAASPETVAAAALKAAPVFDGHNDTAEGLRDRAANVINGFDFTDTSRRTDPGMVAMHTDLARLRKGHVGAQFWSVYVTANQSEPESVRQVIEQIDVMKRLTERYPADLALVTTAAGVETEMKRGRIAGLLGAEGGHSIGSSLAVLRQLHALGVRYMTITHSKNTPWADSATDAPRNDGLNDFGRDVIREMNRLGVIVDLSHVSEATMVDVFAIAKAPVIFSHSGSRAVDAHPRNVPDSVLPLVKANGGVIMVVFYPSFVSNAVRLWEAARNGERTRADRLNPGDPDAAKAQVAAWEAANPAPRATLAQVADHIDHIKGAIGIDHIGLGGDFDGMDVVVEGLENVSTYPALFTELARRGYTKAELMQIASGNVMRVLRGVEAAALAQKSVPPFESPAAK